MRAKKKLIISMLVVSFVLLSIIATVAIAFALTQQTIKTTLNIGYTVEDIDGTASATFTVGGVTENLTAMKGTQVIGDKLVFKAGDTEDAGNLMFPEDALALSAQNDNVVIQYTYSNTGAKHYIASMDFAANIEADNMKVEYSINGTDYSEQRYAVVVPANTSNRSYWIKISIEDKAKSASFTGDFNWLLNGCDASETNEAYKTLTSLEIQESTTEAGSYSIKLGNTDGYMAAGQKVVFPSEVNGDAVTKIVASNLTEAQKEKVSSVVIPETVTTIGTSAFDSFSNLEEITFEQNEVAGASSENETGLTTIEAKAFYACKELKSIDFPETLIGIGSQAFWYCEGLTSLYLPMEDSWDNAQIMESWSGNPFAYCPNIETIEGPNAYNNGWYCYSSFSLVIGCKNTIVSNSRLDSTGMIDWYAFAGCTDLENVSISSDFQGQICGYAFADCAKLKSVTFEAGAEYSISDNAFKNCPSLTDFVLPSFASFQEDNFITSKTFVNCPNLKNITIKDLTEQTLASLDVFMELTNNLHLIIGNEITEISYDTLNCPNVTQLTIGNCINSLSDGDINHCFPNLEHAALSEGVTYLGAQFRGCSTLKTITIPSSVRYMGEEYGISAFDGTNRNLTHVIVKDATNWNYTCNDGTETTSGSADELIMSDSSRLAQWFTSSMILLLNK